MVEFKGTAVDDAIEQIISTYEIINNKIQKHPQNYLGVIVSSGVPAGTEQKFRRLKEKCYKEKHLKVTKAHFWHMEKI